MMLEYDLIIRNVEVFDGTGEESFVTDVALKDGKIVHSAKQKRHTLGRPSIRQYENITDIG